MIQHCISFYPKIWAVFLIFVLGVCGSSNCSSPSLDETQNQTDTMSIISIDVNGKRYTTATLTDAILLPATTDTLSIRVVYSTSLHILASDLSTQISLEKKTGTTEPNLWSATVQDSLLSITAKGIASAHVYECKIPSVIYRNSRLTQYKAYQSTALLIQEKNGFSSISTDSLLNLVERKTFNYFWEHAGTNSGMARERSNANVVTTGGTGFGIMAMIAATERKFISRSEALDRITNIVFFLQHTATRYHGAWAHWIIDATGATQAFSPNDDGADLVETAFLMQGLLCAKTYFNGANSKEQALATSIQQLWESVEWTWFQQEDRQNVLYWHWSPTKRWIMNHPIQGYNEALIVYLLAASSPTYPIEKSVYDYGWALGGGIKNGKSFYGITLPLGYDYGGPLFFSHYSFLGLDPRRIKDQYADYWEQNVAHTLINRSYCIANPKKYALYSAYCWGLTASDNDQGYDAHSPTNDLGIITPTAALSSFPYSPKYSLLALYYFYYLKGNSLWKEYGFKDALSVSNGWVASDYLAIDQGPIVVMIENYRTQLLWNLFMYHPDIQQGLNRLGMVVKSTPEPMQSIE